MGGQLWATVDDGDEGEGAEEHVQRCQRGFLSTVIVIAPNTPLPSLSNAAIGVDSTAAGRAATSPACRAATWWAGVAPCGSWRWDVTLPVPRAVHFHGEDVAASDPRGGQDLAAAAAAGRRFGGHIDFCGGCFYGSRCDRVVHSYVWTKSAIAGANGALAVEQQKIEKNGKMVQNDAVFYTAVAAAAARRSRSRSKNRRRRWR